MRGKERSRSLEGVSYLLFFGPEASSCLTLSRRAKKMDALFGGKAMRHLYLAAGFLVLASMAVCSWAKAGSMDSEAEVRELARQTLDGRQAIVRLYIDWRTNPKAYTTLSVPLAGLDVTFDAVARAAGRSVPEDAVVVVVPGDQQDTLIADVMGGCLFGEPCRADGRITLWPGDIPPIQLKPCLFRDVLDRPLPNTEIEILLSDNPVDAAARHKVWITDARLDENGRMPSLKAAGSCSMHAFLFAVVHPDCGRVTAVSRPRRSEEEHELMVPALPKDDWCVFVDALGRPMAGATVEVIPSWTWEQGREKRSPPTTVQLDEAGRLRPPQANPGLQYCCFLVQDPNYGMAIVEPCVNVLIKKDEPLSLYPIPLVAAGTRADERSIWGTVVDPNGVAIPEAVIKCTRVNVPGGGYLSAWWPGQVGWDKPAKVLTDAQGRFAMHLPLADSDGALGRPVPPGATYEVVIETATGAEFQPCYERLAAGQEHTITLRPKPQASGALSGTLVFQDELGPVTDIEKLKEIVLSIRNPRPGGGFLTTAVGRGGWMEKEELSPGIYTATAEWDGKIYVFGPVQVAAETLKPLILLPQQIKAARQLYCGRVVHGITGEPISGALVMRRPEPGMLGLADQDLSTQLRYAGPELDPDGYLVRLLEANPKAGITRTDASGYFETTAPTPSPMRSFRSLVAIQKDFIGAEQRLAFSLGGVDENGQMRIQEFEPDATGKIRLPDMKLFPAGTIVVKPSGLATEGPRAVKDVRFRYVTLAGDPTPWLKEFWATPLARQGADVFRKEKLLINESQIIYVPADVTLTLTFAVLSGDEQLSPIMIRNIRLRQGQVLDLGRLEFSTGIQIAVRVVDSKGKPVEGITVKSFVQGNSYGSPGAVTDGQGLARVTVPPHSQGRFFVERHDKETRTTVREDVPYGIAGPEDAGREFFLPLSDGFLEQLLDAQ